MSASVLVLALILLLVCGAAIILYGSDDTAYFVFGAAAGFLAVSITAIFVMLYSRKHRNAITNENGFKIQTPENKSSAPEREVHPNDHNIYIKANEMVKSNEAVTSAGPTGSSLNVQPSQKKKVSISSDYTDYTESHYYTEIDEDFINKRKEKQQKKLQHRYDNDAFEEDTLQENVIQLGKSPFTYDYVYDFNPNK